MLDILEFMKLLKKAFPSEHNASSSLGFSIVFQIVRLVGPKSEQAEQAIGNTTCRRSRR